MKKTRKGFTLIELIIVLALFSIIMFSAVRMLDPVTKFYVRSSNFESTTACIDNMKRSIEGNLKYVNRIRGYAYYKPYSDTVSYTDTPDVSAELQEHVKAFYEYFFENRRAIDSAGYIYVLAFDNTAVSEATLRTDTYQVVSDFTNAHVNSGKMILYKFWFNNYDPNHDEWNEVVNSINDTTIDTATYSSWLPVSSVDTGVTDWYVNEKLYGNFDYRFDLMDSTGALMETYTDLATFNPADFTIAISMSELRVNKEAAGLIRVPSTERAVSSFSMKNVLDASAAYSSPGLDYLLTANHDESDPDLVYSADTRVRFAAIDMNPATSYDAHTSTWNFPFDGFYFIYTLPETTYTNGSFIDNQPS
ncbi:MAG: prepilin-type N-terminal cleavage/methylation domain-containing protein [Oscillospiraceae bacterium]|nr:prepilin-type N-terminal cleavage/methylation domain-containing protein [Oscillospiraceae bacterium]